MVIHSREFVEANLRVLQDLHDRRLRDDVIESFMNGTPNPHAVKDDGFDRVERKDGKTIEGRTLTRIKHERRDREGSPGLTLSLIYQFRNNGGWSKEETRAMMLSCHKAEGTRWLREHRDPEGEFQNCWDKAGRTAHAINRDTRRSGWFACNEQDIARVFSFVEALTDVGEQWSQRALRQSKDILDGKHTEGRIVWCLNWLLEHGFVTYDEGPRRAHLYRALVLSDRVVHNPVGGQDTTEDIEDLFGQMFPLESPEEPSLSEYEQGWLDGYLHAASDGNRPADTKSNAARGPGA